MVSLSRDKRSRKEGRAVDYCRTIVQRKKPQELQLGRIVAQQGRPGGGVARPPTGNRSEGEPRSGMPEEAAQSSP